MIFKNLKPSFFKSTSLAGIVIIGLGTSVGFADIMKNAEAGKRSTENPVEDIQEGDSELSETPIEELSDQELIKLLTHEDFIKRQEATLTVWRRGKPIVNALKEAIKSRNPELLSRASTIINYIKIGISPDTPKHITELVKSFSNEDRHAKAEILRKLYAEKQYSLMLYMLSEMEDQKMARDLYSYRGFHRLAHSAAQESIEMGDLNRAIEQLKLAPKNEEVMRSLAYLYKHSGGLDAELKRLKKLPVHKVDKSLELALYLATGNRSEIRKYAQKKGLPRVLATLNLLEGNPDLMVEQITANAPFVSKVGLEVLKAQYAADDNYSEFVKSKHEEQLETLKLFEGNMQTVLVKQIVKFLALTGAKDLVEPYLLENYQFIAFSHFTYQEEPLKALQAIEINDESSLKDFIKRETELALKDYGDRKGDLLGIIEDRTISSDKLLQLTEFYHNRNDVNKAKQVIEPLINKTKKLKNNEWQELIEALANQGLYDLAVEFIIENGKDNNEVFDEMVLSLFNDAPSTESIWSTLKLERNSKEEAFRDMALLMGVEQEKIEEYVQLQDELLKKAKKKGNLDEMRKALFEVTLFRQDYVSHVKYAKQLLDSVKGLNNESLIKARKNDYLRALASTVDRKSLVEFLDGDRAIMDSSSKRYAIYSIAQRKLGNEEAADELLEHAKLLSMGLPDKLAEIADEHTLAGYHDQSLEVMEQVLLALSDERNPYVFYAILDSLSKSETSYIHTKQWGKAAAFLMTGAVQQMIETAENSNVEYASLYFITFYNLHFTRGMELYQKGEKAKALKMLSAAHDVMSGNGALADHFYPAIRTTDLDEQYDEWVEASYKHVKNSLEAFPNCGNTHNTMAWLLSRAVRKLDLAFEHSKKSHELSPFEAAYLDTMAEVWHAKGDREKAIEWGEKAVMSSMYGRLSDSRRSYARYRTFSLAGQLERFRAEPHPKP